MGAEYTSYRMARASWWHLQEEIFVSLSITTNLLLATKLHDIAGSMPSIAYNGHRQ